MRESIFISLIFGVIFSGELVFCHSFVVRSLTELFPNSGQHKRLRKLSDFSGLTGSPGQPQGQWPFGPLSPHSAQSRLVTTYRVGRGVG